MPRAELSKTVTAIYDAVLDDEHRIAALQSIAEYVGAAGAAYLLVEKATNLPRSVAWWGCFSGDKSAYLSHYSKIDPFRAARQHAAAGSWARIRETLSEQVLAYDEWYNDFIRAGGVRDTLSGKLYESGSHIVLIGLQQAIGDQHPPPRDPAALEALVEPLRKAASLHVGLQEAGYRSSLALGALDLLPSGVIFASGDGRLLSANQAGEKLLSQGDGLSINDGRLCARRSFETAKLTGLIAAAASTATPAAGCMLVSRNDGRTAYIVRVAPVGAALAGVDRPIVMLSVTATGEYGGSERDLTELYGLSPSESRLAMALASGRRPAEIAAEFGVQITTIRTQLSAVLKKLGVERQSDIVRLIYSIPTLRSPASPASTE